MKESYTEGVAIHGDHESCADSREAVREAFDSGMCRIGIEPRKEGWIRVSTRLIAPEDYILSIVIARCFENSAWSETLGMHRNFLHGNREISRTTRNKRVRIGNPNGESR